jgi:tRNA threonylcarbamoyladenosine biosynthesis protein TsaB
MIILVIKTDSPEARIAIYENNKKLVEQSWLAHKQLSNTIHRKVDELVSARGKSLQDLNGIIVFKGPGSFTGLRIGLSFANALSYSYRIPIVATGGDNWLSEGIKMLSSGQNDRIALPRYGAEAHITKPRK